MYPVTKAMLERSVQVLRAHQPWADYSIGYAYGQPRLEAKNGSVDVSPRGTKRLVNDYMWTMLKALRMEEDHKRDATPDLIKAAQCAIDSGFEVQDEYGKQHWAISETQRNNVRTAIDKATS